MKFNTIKRTTKNVIIVLMAGLFVSSCSDYLDVVPDNVPTLDHAFANRHACERIPVHVLQLFARNGRLY